MASIGPANALGSYHTLINDGWNICQGYAGVVPKARKLVDWSALITCLTIYKDVRLSPS